MHTEARVDHPRSMYKVTDKFDSPVAEFEDPDDLRKFCLNRGWGDGHVDNLLEELEQSGLSTVYDKYNFYHKG